MQHNEHGGGIWRVARQLGIPAEEILDFSASINPLGMPRSVLEAARNALTDAVHYPEIDAASLRSALADFHGLPESCFLPGSGSTELIHLLPRVLRPRRALVVTPAFSEYARALRQAGVIVDAFPLDPLDGFCLAPEALLRSLLPDTDLIVLANPGNPTGAGIPPQIVEILARGAVGRLVVVDEAFVDFSPGLSVIDRVPSHDNLCVLRSLTKFYAMPGLRAGYLATSPRIAPLLAEAQVPWALSSPALAAAHACLLEEDYRKRTLEQIPIFRRELAAGLAALGLTVFPSEANYLLGRLEQEGRRAAMPAASLRTSGILIRDCTNFPPLDGRYLRVAVRSPQENARLIRAMERALA